MLRSVVLVCLLLALSHGSAQVCLWDLSVDQGLNPISLDSGARFLAFDAPLTANDSDVTAACQWACCADPQCDLALIKTPQDDGTPQCVLVGGCGAGGHCVLQPDTQVQTYRRALQDNHVRPSESQSDGLVPPSESPSENLVPTSDALVPPSESQSDGLVPPAESPSENLVPTSDALVPPSESLSVNDVPKTSQGDGDEEKNATGANTGRCRAPMKVGVCRAAFPKFYYDVANQGCREFVYGGCGANGNNFETREECEAACSGVTGSVIEEETPASAEFVAKAGRRMAVDPISYEALENAVEAEAREMADHAEEPQTTGVTVDQKVSLPEMSQEDFADRCEAAPVAGPCRASMKRWFYSPSAGTCQVFVYGGCRGNENNHASQESCMATCTVTVVPSSRKVLPSRAEVDADNYAEFCLSASDSGPCRAYFPQFYFHADSGSCRPFVYGGCRGNNNRYLTSEECMDRCAVGLERGLPRQRNRGTAAFFLVATLAVMSALLLAVLVVITLRRSRYTALPRRASTVSDKEELIPESDEQSSMESISAPGSPVVGKA